LKNFLIWFVYNILFAVGYTLMMPKFLMRMWRRGGYRADFSQRFGNYDSKLLAKIQEKPRIWVHAVSVGEVFVALHFIYQMREVFPGTGFILTTTTSTGHAQAEKKISEDDVLLYFPTDLPFIAKKVVRLLKPIAVVLTEGELWPNLLRRLTREQVPVFVINGRMSASSFRGYRKVLPFFRRAVALVDLLMVQSFVDKQRFVDLGTPEEKVVVMGSAKYDVARPDPAGIETAKNIMRDAGMNPDGMILVGGSTWPGEEKVLLEIFVRLREIHPKLQFILVPRHMERRDEVETILKASGLAYIKRTEMGGDAEMLKREMLKRGNGDGEKPSVLLADTTGELMGYYGIGTVVFVGKSLGDNDGGQNPIEPAMFEKPIVVGPHMENFPGVMDDFIDAKALIQVADAYELEQQLKALLGDAEMRRAYGERAGTLVAEKRGVVAHSIELMRERIEPLICTNLH